jgi:hypothetical protein
VPAFRLRSRIAFFFGFLVVFLLECL